MPDDGVAARLAAVRTAVSEAAERAGRDPAGIRVLAVTKTFPPGAVSAALAAGLTDIGENYVQEAQAKRAAVGTPTSPALWHLIGGLQRNKVRAAVATFDWVQTLDSPELATALDAAAEQGGRRLTVLVQVNVAGDRTKRGVLPDGAEGLGRSILACRHLVLAGFMTVPAAAPAAEAARPWFRALRALRDRCQERLGVELPHLSMGMSADFRVAVEEGATMLRLGRALFGARV